jgi:vanillate O-demethylase ferredoxin subunit
MAPGDGEFSVQIASTGLVLQVPANRSIVEVLSGAAIGIETSCQTGLCATCKVRYLSGDVDHRDFILSDEEHAEYLTACVSRSKGSLLVLDL